MKKVLMGSVLLASPLPWLLRAVTVLLTVMASVTMLHSPPAGLTPTRTMTASVIMPVRAPAGALWTRITMVSATMPDRAAAAMRTPMAMGFAITTAKADAAVVPAS